MLVIWNYDRNLPGIIQILAFNKISGARKCQTA